jgi:hypothetical protein
VIATLLAGIGEPAQDAVRGSRLRAKGKRVTDCRSIVFGLCLLGYSVGVQAATSRKRPPPPPLKAQIGFMPIACEARRLPVRYGEVGAIHTARRGELIVPPGDYSQGLLPLDPRQPNAGLTGRVIYDAALLDVDGESMIFEVRTYNAADLKNPQTSETHSFSVTDKIVQLRQLRLAISAVKGTAISYRIAFVPPAATSARETETTYTERRGDAPQMVVAPAKE